MSKKNFILSLTALGLACISWSCASLFSERTCSVTQKTLTEPKFNVYMSVYADTVPVKKSVIILPPTGGTNIIDKRYADQFCSAGYDVYLVNSWTSANSPSDYDLKLHQRSYQRSQDALTGILSEIHTPFIGILGTSLGALYAAVAANYQDKINAVFLIVGGAPIMEVVVTSDQQAMQDLLKIRKEKYGYKDNTEYLEALNKAFNLEPTLLGEKYKSKDFGMSIAMNDEKVSTKTQLQLAEFFKPKKIIKYESSHFWGIVKTWLYSSDEIVEFFNESSKKRLQ